MAVRGPDCVRMYSLSAAWARRGSVRRSAGVTIVGSISNIIAVTIKDVRMLFLADVKGHHRSGDEETYSCVLAGSLQHSGCPP